MASKSGRAKTKFVAKLVTENRKPCAFCLRDVDDEVIYGKLYSIGDIQCHYFCALLSCCLIQKGKDEDGLFGFLYPDILAEIERCKKHRCSYCNKDGANMGCHVSQCRKQFHLPCGRERNAVSLFYGNFKTFCKNHAPKQKISENVMVKARLRKQAKNNPNKPLVIKESVEVDEEDLKAETVCVICYEDVDCFPTPDTFWPPCCARDAWFHRSCIQRMSLSAGMHYIKCPLCNDKENFYQAVISQGFYVPDRDAAWEMEQNAFAEIYNRELKCGLPVCHCPSGRDYDSESGAWDIKLCLLCGSVGAHDECLSVGEVQTPFVCTTCAPAAPEDLDGLASTIENVILSEQAVAACRCRPVMPSRMSLRRTKQRQAMHRNMNSSQSQITPKESIKLETSNTTTSRLDLNLKKPTRQSQILKGIENNILSPVKMIEQGFIDKVKMIGGDENIVLEPKVVESVREILRKPKPLSAKRKIVDDLLEDLVNNMMSAKRKVKEPVRTWCSPKKERLDEANNDVQVKKENSNPDQVDIKQIKQEHITVNTNFDIITSDTAIITASQLLHTKTMTEKQVNTNVEENVLKTETNIKNAEDAATKEKALNVSDCTEEKSNEIITEVIHCDSIEEKTKEVITEIHSDDSNSTFNLPPEFIAGDSDNSLTYFETPKKLKTVQIEKDSSMEIYENNDIVNIDVVEIKNNEKAEFLKNFKLETPKDKYAFIFSPTNKETLESNMDKNIDIESFKNQYLNEVDKHFKCNYSHSYKHKDDSNESAKLRTAIDFAINAALKTNKQKKKKSRKRRRSGIVLKYDVENSKKRKTDSATEVSIKNSNVSVKIKLKKKKFRLRITQNKESPKTLKQYVLKYSEGKEIIGKPEKDVTPIKRKYVKQEKSPDNLVQTSIQSFFKGKSISKD